MAGRRRSQETTSTRLPACAYAAARFAATVVLPSRASGLVTRIVVAPRSRSGSIEPSRSGRGGTRSPRAKTDASPSPRPPGARPGSRGPRRGRAFRTPPRLACSNGSACRSARAGARAGSPRAARAGAASSTRDPTSSGTHRPAVGRDVGVAGRERAWRRRQSLELGQRYRCGLLHRELPEPIVQFLDRDRPGAALRQRGDPILQRVPLLVDLRRLQPREVDDQSLGERVRDRLGGRGVLPDAGDPQVSRRRIDIGCAPGEAAAQGSCWKYMISAAIGATFGPFDHLREGGRVRDGARPGRSPPHPDPRARSSPRTSCWPRRQGRFLGRRLADRSTPAEAATRTLNAITGQRRRRTLMGGRVRGEADIGLGSASRGAHVKVTRAV